MGVSLVFLALFLSISVLMFFHPLISSFANHNSNTDPLFYMAVRAFLFCIVPFQFFSAVILLLLRVVALAPLAFFIKHLARAAWVLLSATLLLAVPLVVHALSVSEILPPDALIVMVVVGAAAIILKYCNPYERYTNLAGQTAGSFVPAIMALCILVGSFLFIDSFSVPLSDVNHESTLVPVPILLLLLSLDCLTFFSVTVLLFLRIGMPVDGPQNHPIAVGMIKNLVEATSAMSFTTTVLVASYMLVP